MASNTVSHPHTTHQSAIWLNELSKPWKRDSRRSKKAPWKHALQGSCFHTKLLLIAQQEFPPAELLLRVKPGTRLDALFPDPSVHVEHKQTQQNLDHDTSARARLFAAGDSVWISAFIVEARKSTVIHCATGRWLTVQASPRSHSLLANQLGHLHPHWPWIYGWPREHRGYTVSTARDSISTLSSTYSAGGWVYRRFIFWLWFEYNSGHFGLSCLDTRASPLVSNSCL